MTDKRYTVEEIDAMRLSVRNTIYWSRQASSENLAQTSEDQLRTYMLNGTRPEELAERAVKALEKCEADRAAVNHARWKKQQECKHEMSHKNRSNFSECEKCGFMIMDSKT